MVSKNLQYRVLTLSDDAHLPNCRVFSIQAHLNRYSDAYTVITGVQVTQSYTSWTRPLLTCAQMPCAESYYLAARCSFLECPIECVLLLLLMPACPQMHRITLYGYPRSQMSSLHI